jgi:hypothetical protein
MESVDMDVTIKDVYKLLLVYTIRIDEEGDYWYNGFNERFTRFYPEDEFIKRWHAGKRNE